MRLKQVELTTTAYLADQLVLSGLPQVAFAGRSNVGKSSLLNRLFNRKNLAKVSQTPGKTRSINYFCVNDKYNFVDLPGYGYAKISRTERERWRQLIEYYFTNCQVVNGLIQLVDIRHPATALDLELIAWSKTIIKQRLIVLTKSDKLSKNKRVQARAKISKQLGIKQDDTIAFSAVTGEGKDLILNWVENTIENNSKGV